MKIILTGGGTGGHFYPLISIAQELQKEAKEKKLLDIKIYYMAPTPYNESLLFENRITFIRIRAGKMRKYFSILNFLDLFKTAWGAMNALIQLFKIYPDVVFGKGGYVSFPVLFAARLLRIPVVIHESDSVPGRVNLWASRFAKRIAVSYPEAAEFFPKEKVAYTGNPIRRELMGLQTTGAHEFLKLEQGTPVVLILGGSLGSKIINETILDALPRLVEKYQVIHQTGRLNFKEVSETSKIVLQNSAHKERYIPFDYLNTLAIRMSAGIADLIISRAGSTIFEIAIWGIPSIIIPISESNGDHQRKNAYAYARAGAALVIEESNLNASVLNSEIDRLMNLPAEREKMKKSAQQFGRVNSGQLIAEEIIGIALQHER